MNIQTFRSTSAHLCVMFPQDRFGFMVLEDQYQYDEVGRVVIDPRTNEPMHKRVPKPSAMFGAPPNPPGCLKLDSNDPRQKEMIEDLKKHEDFGSLFWLEDINVQAVVDQLDGKVLIDRPKELSEEHFLVLDALASYYDNAIPPKARPAARAHLERALELFRVRGIALPPDTEEHNKRLLLGRIRDFLFAAEQADLLEFKSPGDEGGEGADSTAA